MFSNGKRLNDRIAQLAEIGKVSDTGVTRLSLTDEYKEAEALVSQWMQEAGLTVRIDAVGNLIGRLDAVNTDKPAILIGSHIDTVINGGQYDGTIGVIGGIEVVQCLQENKVTLDHPLEVIVFIEEESTRWGVSTLGSHAMVGQINKHDVLARKDPNGITMAKTMQSTGIDPARITDAKRDQREIACYLELHIEQGAVLEDLGLSVGVVTGIAGQVIFELQLTGKADHAGATPMNLRRDALVCAAELVLAAKKTAEETAPTSVATVGMLEPAPGAINVVPGNVRMTFDLRDIYEDNRDTMEARLKEAVAACVSANKLKYQLKELYRLKPVLLPDCMVNTISTACEKLNIPVHTMPSGASHDAQVMTEITDVGMIFVRSRDGISHNPLEYSSPDDIALGADLMYQTVILLDKKTIKEKYL